MGSLIQSWALSVFFNFFNNKKWFYCIFIKLLTYFLLFKKPTPSQINFIKNAKNHFLLLKKCKNTQSAQLCSLCIVSVEIDLSTFCKQEKKWQNICRKKKKKTKNRATKNMVALFPTGE